MAARGIEFGDFEYLTVYIKDGVAAKTSVPPEQWPPYSSGLWALWLERSGQSDLWTAPTPRFPVWPDAASLRWYRQSYRK